MKLLSMPILFATLVFSAGCAGCAGAYRGITLAPVGPAPAPPSAAATGQLIVFSAYDVHPPALNKPDFVQTHTDYVVVRTDSRAQLSIHNQTGAWGQDPANVELPPGHYCVEARANGYGLVTVPVVIEAYRRTVIHLEGGGTAWDRAGAGRSDFVCLPDGRIIGWRAGASPPGPFPTAPATTVSGAAR